MSPLRLMPTPTGAASALPSSSGSGDILGTSGEESLKDEVLRLRRENQEAAGRVRCSRTSF